MNPVIVSVTILLAILTIWGFVSPRSQWRVLASWTRREPHANEPGPVAFGFQRVVAGIGVVILLVAGGAGLTGYVDEQARAHPVAPAIERMWGVEPKVVNRVFNPSPAAPTGFLDQPIVGYQVVNGIQHQPAYLFTLPDFLVKKNKVPVGYIGTTPAAGFTALDTADIVIAVRADPACIPRDVVVHQDDKKVQIAVFYGRLAPDDGSSPLQPGKCKPKGGAHAVTTLIPIDLDGMVDDRTVTTLEGKKIHKVKAIED